MIYMHAASAHGARLLQADCFERQDGVCTSLVHHELESILSMSVVSGPFQNGEELPIVFVQACWRSGFGLSSLADTDCHEEVYSGS